MFDMEKYTVEIDGNAYTVKGKFEHVDGNPYMKDSSMLHYRCTLMYKGKRYTLPFSKGVGHKGVPPCVAEVLYCCFSDNVEYYRDFVDWCRNLGYSPDSRNAEKIYNACIKNTKNLYRLLEDDVEIFEEALRDY